MVREGRANQSPSGKLCTLLPLKKYNSSTYRYKENLQNLIFLDTFELANVDSGKISLALPISSRIKNCIAYEVFCLKAVNYKTEKGTKGCPSISRNCAEEER